MYQVIKGVRGAIIYLELWHDETREKLVKQRRIFFIRNKSVSLYVHIYKDIRDPTIKLFL